jgi:hypothetical protein
VEEGVQDHPVAVHLEEGDDGRGKVIEEGLTGHLVATPLKEGDEGMENGIEGIEEIL